MNAKKTMTISINGKDVILQATNFSHGTLFPGPKQVLAEIKLTDRLW